MKYSSHHRNFQPPAGELIEYTRWSGDNWLIDPKLQIISYNFFTDFDTHVSSVRFLVICIHTCTSLCRWFCSNVSQFINLSITYSVQIMNNLIWSAPVSHQIIIIILFSKILHKQISWHLNHMVCRNMQSGCLCINEIVSPGPCCSGITARLTGHWLVEFQAYGTQLHTFHITTFSLGWLGSIIENMEVKGKVVMETTDWSRNLKCYAANFWLLRWLSMITFFRETLVQWLITTNGNTFITIVRKSWKQSKKCLYHQW